MHWELLYFCVRSIFSCQSCTFESVKNLAWLVIFILCLKIIIAISDIIYPSTRLPWHEYDKAPTMRMKVKTNFARGLAEIDRILIYKP